MCDVIIDYDSEEDSKKGQIRVGRISFNKDSSRNVPSFEGFTPILVLTKSYEYGSLGPYELCDDQGRNMENLWQFSKVYRRVPKTDAYYTERIKTPVWSWPAETHTDENGEPNEKYWKWREAGMNSRMAIRYPVGKTVKARASCLYALKEKGGKRLDYVESRREIYMNLYVNLVKEKKQFKELKKRLENGENLLIIETDGPHMESLDHYIDKYQVGEDFIVNDTMLATAENLTIMCNDTKHAFGHGYCLAAALLEIENEI